MKRRLTKDDLYIAGWLQTFQFFDTTVLPCYLAKVLPRSGVTPIEWEIWSSGSQRRKDKGRSSGTCAFPTGGPG